MIANISWLLPWHSLYGDTYQFYSGIGSDISELTLLAALAVYLRKHNCHVHGCWRLSWHPHPEHGHEVCRRHHPDHPSAGGKKITS